ncbi:BLUF domain-containing protein, partial [Pseudomonas aeruginosa]|uniref:BLUF domain-containing protein n=1 Tax=Pseudomonas aeruginosa TaxID=287 RepID=UPI0024B75C49
IIYRSHICDDVPVKALETMVAAADSKNRQSDVTGILLFNGTHFFQLLEGPVENVTAIYEQICRDPRHHNVVELILDHGPSWRFGHVGMELFDLRHLASKDGVQQVLNTGTIC